MPADLPGDRCADACRPVLLLHVDPTYSQGCVVPTRVVVSAHLVDFNTTTSRSCAKMTQRCIYGGQCLDLAPGAPTSEELRLGITAGLPLLCDEPLPFPFGKRLGFLPAALGLLHVDALELLRVLDVVLVHPPH